MRNRILDRLLIFCYVVITVAITVITALRIFDIDLAQRFFDGLSVNAPGIFSKLIVAGIAVIVVLLGLLTLVEITPSRRKKANFITISGDEAGDVRVAIPAMNDMVKQALAGIDGLSEMNVEITENSDSISMVINLDVESSVHVPTVTMNMQQAVRTHVQTTCGVAVKNVSVVVRNVIPAVGEIPAAYKAAAPAEAIIAETDAYRADEAADAYEESAFVPEYPAEDAESAVSENELFAETDQGNNEEKA